MSLSDPIGDMIARLKNAQMRGYKKIQLPSSKFKTKIAEVLKNEGYIINYKVINDDNASILEIDLTWKGEGTKEVGIDASNDKIIIKIDKKYYRPTEVESLLGDSSKAARQLNWKPKITFDELVKEMIMFDYNKI